MKITRKLLSTGKRARPGIKFAKPLESVVIHWIGPYPGQAVSTPWNWWENGSDGKGIRASAHFVLKNEDIIQCLPLDEVGWHSGDLRNYNSIGIEVVPMSIDGEFSRATIETLKLLVQHIRHETGRYLELERHYDGVQKKDCPKFYTPLSNAVTKDEFGYDLNGQERWERLRQFLDGEWPYAG